MKVRLNLGDTIRNRVHEWDASKCKLSDVNYAYEQLGVETEILNYERI